MAMQNKPTKGLARITGDVPTKAAVLDEDEVVLWRGFLAWSEEVVGKVSQALADWADTSVADYEILKRVHDTEGSIGQNELLRSLGWTASRLSHQLRRMEDRGMVRRRELGRGRHMIVRLTPKGRSAIVRADIVHAGAVRAALLKDLDPNVAEALRRAYRAASLAHDH